MYKNKLLVAERQQNSFKLGAKTSNGKEWSSSTKGDIIKPGTENSPAEVNRGTTEFLTECVPNGAGCSLPIRLPRERTNSRS